MVTLDMYWLNAVISIFLPIIVALVTKQTASGTWKSLTLLALSIVTATLTQIQASGGTFDLVETAKATLLSFVVAVATHFGLLKPMSVTGTDGAVQSKVTGGIG